MDGWSIFRLPRSHWHAQLSNFDWTTVSPKSLKEQVEAFVAAVEAGRAPHLILTGLPGIGKSHIGVGCYRSIAAKFGTELITWLNVPKFCEAVKRSYDGDADPWTDIESAKRLVVMDDLFGRTLSPHEADQIMYRLIDTAYQNNAAVLVTMNQDVTELPSRLAGHEISRLLFEATIVRMQSPKDRRLK